MQKGYPYPSIQNLYQSLSHIFTDNRGKTGHKFWSRIRGSIYKTNSPPRCAGCFAAHGDRTVPPLISELCQSGYQGNPISCLHKREQGSKACLSSIDIGDSCVGMAYVQHLVAKAVAVYK